MLRGLLPRQLQKDFLCMHREPPFLPRQGGGVNRRPRETGAVGPNKHIGKTRAPEEGSGAASKTRTPEEGSGERARGCQNFG